jgi:hypothetical protein
VHIQSLAQAQGQGFIFMDDNAPVYHARVVTQYLAHHQIQHMDWPGGSPDLNPMKHVWDMLQHAIYPRPVPLASVQQLEQALIQEWGNLD